jgi:hypothetical protein
MNTRGKHIRFMTIHIECILKRKGKEGLATAVNDIGKGRCKK